MPGKTPPPAYCKQEVAGTASGERQANIRALAGASSSRSPGSAARRAWGPKFRKQGPKERFDLIR